MVLDIAGGLFKDNGLFKNSPEDNETLIFKGNRMIPSGGEAIIEKTKSNNPGTTANDASFGTTAWINTDNIKLSDDNVATSPLGGAPRTSQYLKATNFGFAIPTNKTILGIVVKMEKFSIEALDIRVRIVKSDASIGTEDKSKTDFWPKDHDLIDTYGTKDDLWGETWTPADINNANFGVVLAGTYAGFIDLQVDNIKIEVYYIGE